MKKIYALFALLTVFVSVEVKAQMPYNFSYHAETYQPLSGGTSLNMGNVWDGYNDNFVAPVNFIYKLGKDVSNYCYLSGGNITFADTSFINLNAFFLTDASLIDRGAVGSGSSLSPIRYTVTGTPGSRIFKVEISNAGFHGEVDSLGTLNDYVSMQEWIYEGSNIVELRYGPSQVSYPSQYFSFGKPIVGFANNIDSNGTGTLYALSGSPFAPGIDSIVLVNGNPSSVGSLLNAFPSSGMVYRFTPRPLSVHDVAVTNARVYPTQAQNEIMVDYNGTGVAAYIVTSVNGSSTNKTGTLINGTTHINVADLAAGMYLVTLQTTTGKSVKKFVKL